MSIAEIMAALRNCAGIFDAYHKTSFECYRKAKGGAVQKVLVEIFDAGPDRDPNTRYHCVATTEDGRGTSGNPGASVGVVLAMVHWGRLDEPPSPHQRRQLLKRALGLDLDEPTEEDAGEQPSRPRRTAKRARKPRKKPQ